MTRCRWCYGLAIPTTSLIIAARAWPRVKRAFRIIDLISARKKAGTLAVGMKMVGPEGCAVPPDGAASALAGAPGAAADDTLAASQGRLPEVPQEFWDDVRQYVAEDLYSEEEDRFVFRVHVMSDDELWEELAEQVAGEAGHADRPGRARLTLEHFFACYDCLVSRAGHPTDWYSEFMRSELASLVSCHRLTRSSKLIGFHQFSSSLFQLIMGMLADHKLQIPCVQVLEGPHPGKPDGPEPTSLVAVTGLVRATSIFGAQQLIPIHRNGLVEALAQAHDPFFDHLPGVPAEVDSRFTRLLCLIPAEDRTARFRTGPDEEDPQDAPEFGAVTPRPRPDWKRVSVVGGYY